MKMRQFLYKFIAFIIFLEKSYATHLRSIEEMQMNSYRLEIAFNAFRLSVSTIGYI